MRLSYSLTEVSHPDHQAGRDHDRGTLIIAALAMHSLQRTQ